MAEKHTASSDEEENFEDAGETIPISETMSLKQALEECHVALNLFLNNRFDDATKRLQPWSSRSMYHALGYGTIMFLQATMTFEPSHISNAVSVVKRATDVCNKQRRKASLSLRAVNYDKFTAEELHAELCYAECLIERAMLTFIEDENLISFIKGSLKIRSCYQSYKECRRLLERRQWKDDDYKENFESGVRMGTGLFNLLISQLPSRIMKLLEFVGFSGNRARGLSDLETGNAISKGVRAPLCGLALLGYHTVVSYVLGTGCYDISFSDRILQNWLQFYPKGAMFLFFAGRVEEIKGNIKTAVLRFEESIESQAEWKQFHHLCFWELMWCHAFAGDWLLAMKYAERLCRESRWSRATYTYQKAAFLLMCEQSEESKQHLAALMGGVPKLKQRIAGKSLPIEKFAVKKAKRFFDQKERLTLAAYELIYVWNGFAMLCHAPDLVKPMLAIVEETLRDIVAKKDSLPLYTDDNCLAILLKGMCLKCLGQVGQAEQCFREIQSMEKSLVQDLYLVPYSQVELALLHLEQGKLDDCKAVLDRTKEKYKGYSLESRCHFRIHATYSRIRTLRRQDSVSDSLDLQADLNSSSVQLDDKQTDVSITADKLEQLLTVDEPEEEGGEEVVSDKTAGQKHVATGASAKNGDVSSNGAKASGQNTRL